MDDRRRDIDFLRELSTGGRRDPSPPTKRRPEMSDDKKDLKIDFDGDLPPRPQGVNDENMRNVFGGGPDDGLNTGHGSATTDAADDVPRCPQCLAGRCIDESGVVVAC